MSDEIYDEEEDFGLSDEELMGIAPTTEADLTGEVTVVTDAEEPEVPEDDEADEDSDEYMKIICMQGMDHYRYIESQDVYFNIRTGGFLGEHQFNKLAGDKFPMYRSSQNKMIWSTASKAFHHSKYFNGIAAHYPEVNSKNRVGKVREYGPHKYLNTYIKSSCGVRKGDVSLFMKLIENLFEHPEDQKKMLHCMKWTIEHAGDPQTRLKFAPFITGEQGNGKSTIIGILGYIIGLNYFTAPDAAALKGNFNGFIQGKLLVNLNEIYRGGSGNLPEKIKAWVTDTHISIHPKGKEAYLAPNTAVYWITTNNADVLEQSEDDRRFANFKCRGNSLDDLYKIYGGEDQKDDFFSELYDWLENKNGYAKINHYLRKVVKYGDFDGTKGSHRITKSHQEVLLLQKNENDTTIDEAAAVLDKVFTAQELADGVRDLGQRVPKPDVRDRVLKRLGYKLAGGKFFHATRLPMGMGATQARLAYPKDMDSKEAGKAYVKRKKREEEGI